MKHTTISSHKQTALWWPLCSVTFILIIMQIGLFLPRLKPLIETGMLSKHTAHIPAVIYPDILFTLLVHLSLWLLVTLLIYIETKSLGALLHIKSNKMLRTSLIIWGITIVAIFSANQYFYPRSLFTDFTSTLLHPILNKWILMTCSFLLLLILVLTFIHLLKWLIKHRYLTASLLITMSAFWLYHDLRPIHIQQHVKPNIIIIGLDSLRPDFVGFYGSDRNLTPNLDKFLKKASNFTHASIPLGRTFPAWISILTGRFPKEDGARYDLIEPHKLNLDALLPRLLKNEGYFTVYATDERRFSNIDESYGFDKIVGPKLGFNDFLLGTLNDFPLSNLIVNTKISKWLFPYNHMNRGDNVTYYPYSFTKALQQFLRHVTDRPLFLNVHFCVSHFPYSWASTSPTLAPPKNFQQLQTLYIHSLEAVDRQFQKFITFLKEKNLLDNTIVLVLSDHGEALHFPGDRITQQKNYIANPKNPKGIFQEYIKKYPNGSLDTSLGHGTDVLSPSQYQIVFAWRIYGKKQNEPSHLNFPVNLIDIKPTLLNLLGLDDKKSSGISLASYLYEPKLNSPASRPLFSESGFSPDAIMAKRATVKSIIELGLQYYRLDPKTGRVIVKDDMGQTIIKSKQYAIMYDQWLLALYPMPDAAIPILVNLTTKQWTDQLSTQFAKQSPAENLLKQLRDFYGDEIAARIYQK